jgi:hypothetical protein
LKFSGKIGAKANFSDAAEKTEQNRLVPMKSEEKALARILFHNKVLNADGQAFETLFTAIISKKYPDFVQVKPQGSIGDKKNDGYSKANGVFFQVYAPEDAKESEGKAVEKIKTDFDGLKTYWNSFCAVKEFYFVLNDKFKGTFPTIEKDLADIKIQHNLEECTCFLARHLEDALFVLADDEIIAIVGFIPNPENITKLDYSIVNQVLAHIMANKKHLEPAQLLTAPDFDQKIQFNGLGQAVGALLKTSSYHAGLVEDYFSLNSNFARQEVRNKLNEIYINKKQIDFGIIQVPMARSDLVFFEILKTCTPNSNEQTQNAALVLMSYFFESCDIFEDPKGKR